jgi:hypothetical protein
VTKAIEPIHLPSSKHITRTATALEISEDLSGPEWVEIGRELARVERSMMWYIGDWWEAGDRYYGDLIALVNSDDWDGPAYQTCANAASVCRAFEFFRRRENLSFSHHEAVASLMGDDPDLAMKLLDECEEERLSVRALRKRVALAREQKDPIASHIQRTKEIRGAIRTLEKVAISHGSQAAAAVIKGYNEMKKDPLVAAIQERADNRVAAFTPKPQLVSTTEVPPPDHLRAVSAACNAAMTHGHSNNAILRALYRGIRHKDLPDGDFQLAVYQGVQRIDF